MASFPIIIFLVVLLGGGLLLVWLHWPRAAKKAHPVEESPGRARTLVQELIEEPVLSAVARREWLDRFLVEQQSGDQEK